MESLIPQILFLGPVFAPLVIRLAAAIFYAFLALHLYRNRASVANDSFPLVGTLGMPWTWICIGLTALVAVLLALGAWTQVVAIVSALGGLKGWIFAKRYPSVFAYDRMAYFLLAVLCILLVIMGAGAFALDKPY